MAMRPCFARRQEFVEVGIPDEGEFENQWLECFIRYGSLLEEFVEFRCRVLELICPGCLDRVGACAGWVEGEFGLAGTFFSVVALRVTA